MQVNMEEKAANARTAPSSRTYKLRVMIRNNPNLNQTMFYFIIKTLLLYKYNSNLDVNQSQFGQNQKPRHDNEDINCGRIVG